MTPASPCIFVRLHTPLFKSTLFAHTLERGDRFWHTCVPHRIVHHTLEAPVHLAQVHILEVVVGFRPTSFLRFCP